MPKVMLVEDDNNLREIYEARMQAEGYDIVSAKDGEEALVIAKAEKPELIISDVMMPKISGFEMLDILRNTDGLKDVKVIMLTALGQADDQQRADRLGADRYLVKSQVTLEDIVNVAHQLLGDTPEPEPVAPAPAAEPAPEPAAVPAPVAVEPPVVESTPAILPVASVAVLPAAEPVMTPTVAEPVAPVSQPEPVVSAAPDPVPSPAPTSPQTSFSAVQVQPSDAPFDATETTVAPQSSDAQTTAQEEATVEAQIEDFVNGASSDAPAAVSANKGVSEPVVQPQPTSADATTTADDKLMAEAVDNLVSNSLPEPAPAPVAQPPQPTAAIVDPSPVQPAPTPPTIAGKKIISPLSSGEAKPDINTLLAEEEAKSILNQPPAQPTAVVMPPAPNVQTPSAAVPDPAATDNRPDPSSISL